MLPKTGAERGTPAGEPEERNLTRALLRQYKAAEAIAYHGYAVQNNPVLTEQDYRTGISRGANPDYRIEGFVFDCYTPDPPIIIRANVEQEQFALSDDTTGDAYNDEWITDAVSAQMVQNTKARILDGVRTGVAKKIHERQAFSFVVNTTDIARQVSAAEVIEMIRMRGLNGLEHLFVVHPLANMPPARINAGVETIKGDVGSHGFSRPYYYDLYEPQQLAVTYARFV